MQKERAATPAARSHKKGDCSIDGLADISPPLAPLAGRGRLGRGPLRLFFRRRELEIVKFNGYVCAIKGFDDHADVTTDEVRV